MAKECVITGKKTLSGNKRSHALNASRRKWNVNLQVAKINVDGKVKKMRVSTRALRTLRNKGDIS